MRRGTVTFDKMRRCSACRRVKLISDYSKRIGGEGKGGYHYICKPCCNARAKEWYANNRERGKATRLAHATALRNEAVRAVGGWLCTCCKETRHSMLDIDHPNGGGLQHRLSHGVNGMYRDMIANPGGYRILCCNCNQSRRRNQGTCEHNTEVRPDWIDYQMAANAGDI